MSDACRDWRGELAATAAGRPDPDKQPGLAAHLEGCRHCREELAELTPVARALQLVDPDRLVDPPRPAGGAWVAASSAAVAEVRRRGAAVGAVAQRGDRRGWRRRRCSRSCSPESLRVSTRPDGPDAQLRRLHHRARRVSSRRAELIPTAAWGTQIALEVDGLARRADDVYWLWLSTSDGDRVAAGTFSGDGHMQMSAALPLDEAARVWVTDADDDVVLDAPVALTRCARPSGAGILASGAGRHLFPSDPAGGRGLDGAVRRLPVGAAAGRGLARRARSSPNLRCASA